MQEAIGSNTSMSQNVGKQGAPRCEKKSVGSSRNTVHV